MPDQLPSPADLTKPVAGAMTTLGRTLGSVMEAGRDILARRRSGLPAAAANSAAGMMALCRELLDHRGEASGLALAGEIIAGYQRLPPAGRLAFFSGLVSEFDVDANEVSAAAERYRARPDLEQLWSLTRAVEAPRQKLFRRINMAPDGTRTLVALRGHLLPLLRDHPGLRAIDSDLRHLFVSWFNKGFLELRRIDWSSPAMVLEKIIDYEAVHQINGWDDLRSRLREDRRCFAFFHPALANDPLVFVEIALTDAIPGDLAPLLVQQRKPATGRINTVVFYSISNCHPGLAGISFGNFLIKNVVEELRKEMPALKTFVTLSPVPGFRRWLATADLTGLVPEALVARVKEPLGRVVEQPVYDAQLKLCAHYLLREKSRDAPLDPVARFHLGNGARLHRMHGGADLSAKGREQSAGIMVNYLYDLARIEENHEAFFDEGRIAVSRTISRLLE
ncbi:MAG: malonyl-CoA decarboxylase [Pseudomonadales bacterium]|nr:malonyl-CoA decarboxylase [Halioglobus sp.]MCP5123730.1 malonyl-CoA decarboxylase [Pseudomonadales bacterium]MCP5192051.1 malonyl-CoA decarboxylase [Pseudomonadales bacterium]